MSEEKVIKRLERLEAAVFGSPMQGNEPAPTVGLDMDLDIRAFANKYAKGLSGAKKFTLLVAFLSKGDPSKEVSLSKIENSWNKMKSVLGGKFNRFHSSVAKTNGWVESKEKGLYGLGKLWREILPSNEKKD